MTQESETPVSRVGWNSETYTDFDRNKTGMGATENLTVNHNQQEVLCKEKTF